MGPRPPAHASQEHLLPPQTAHRDGVPPPRLTGPSEGPEEQGRCGDPPVAAGRLRPIRRTRPVPYPPTGIEPACRLGFVALSPIGGPDPAIERDDCAWESSG